MGKLKDKAKQVKTWISEHKEVLIGGCLLILCGGASYAAGEMIGEHKGYGNGFKEGESTGYESGKLIGENKSYKAWTDEFIGRSGMKVEEGDGVDIFRTKPMSFQDVLEYSQGYDYHKKVLNDEGLEPIEVVEVEIIRSKKKE